MHPKKNICIIDFVLFMTSEQALIVILLRNDEKFKILFGGAKDMTQFFLDAAATSADQAAGGNGTMAMILQWGLIILMLVGLYFLFIRPQKKREKEIQEMRSNIEIGDEIVTAGGIIGRVVSIRDDTLVVESGTDRNKIRLARWAVQANNSLAEEKEISESK